MCSQAGGIMVSLLNSGDWQQGYHIGCGKVIELNASYFCLSAKAWSYRRMSAQHLIKDRACTGRGRLCLHCAIHKGIIW